MSRRTALAAVVVALLSALFFTCTYVFNREAAAWPHGRALLGARIVVLGIVAFSLAAVRATTRDDRRGSGSAG